MVSTVTDRLSGATTTVSVATDRLRGFSIGAAIKAPVYVATTANITLSGTQVVDGLAVGASQRVLVKDQTDASENGIYVSDSSTWARAADADGSRDLKPGTFLYVDRGTQSGQTFWVFNSSSTALTLSPGTDDLTMSQVTVALSGVTNFGTTLVQANASSDARASLNITLPLGTSDIAANAVTLAKMSTNAGGSIVTYSSTGGATVATPGSSGQVLLSGSSQTPAIWAASPAIESSSVMLFYQEFAPTGWTRVTDSTLDNVALVIDTQTALGSFTGEIGTNSFNTVFVSTFTSNADAGSLPDHSHTITSNQGGGSGAKTADNYPPTGSAFDTTNNTFNTGTVVSGAGGTHSHDLELKLKHVRVFLAKKD